MIEKQFEKMWKRLQGKKSQMPNFLREIRLFNIRGIEKLQIPLEYPVSVIAGENASGKSTVLFAAACAYKVPNAGPRDYVPATLFPDYFPKHSGRSDTRSAVIIDYEYSTRNGNIPMRWRRQKAWSQSFFGRKGGKQPERGLYLRTLSNLSNPSEVRGVLQMSHLKSAPQEELLNAVQIDFAQRMLPFKYENVVKISSGVKSLLFAENKSGAKYSELHMSSGERAILRLSREIAQLRDALVLIDEVEAGLHPYVQQLLMLHLQELALINDLQIIVTSHSPVVLNCVPQHARIFLARDNEGKVVLLPAYRDIIQDALYGRSGQTLNLLCEDDAAEGILHGVMDVLSQEEQIRPGSFRVGRDTGAKEFPMHAAAFDKFDRLENMVFILDGDQRNQKFDEKMEDAVGRKNRQINILFLPGDSAPEAWVWDCLRHNPAEWAKLLGVNGEILEGGIKRLDAAFPSTLSKPGEIAKRKLDNLAEALKYETPQICRVVARRKMESPDSDMQVLVDGLKSIFAEWRAI
ncbi:MAG: ATP-binding protein [Gammaproteobacteria bacterium]|nr:ATP-binding protein [Alphaproteobacteria bacterium]MDA8015022.1 ATP-binding protein [Gammaproteobacteria bacterium]